LRSRGRFLACSEKDQLMTNPVKVGFAICALLCVASPGHAASCGASIASTQARVDAAIEKRAGADRPQYESRDATLGHQPTPFSLAATEGEHGTQLEAVLESLDRARAADRAGDVATCRRELTSAKAVLRRQHVR
jgi:hypothetical protein